MWSSSGADAASVKSRRWRRRETASPRRRRRGSRFVTVPFPRRFAERVDLIVLLFDPFKLDISDELTGVIRRFRGHEDKVRVVLNKSADSV